MPIPSAKELFGEGLAYFWLNLACAGGVEDAREQLQTVNGMVTPQQRESAQELARNWKKKTVPEVRQLLEE